MGERRLSSKCETGQMWGKYIYILIRVYCICMCGYFIEAYTDVLNVCITYI